MSQVLPPLLIAFAATALVLVLLSLWSSVRALLSASSGGHAGARMLPERARLLDEKKALLTAIKDLQFERDVGKLSQEDFERFDARYRASARDVLHALEEQVGPHRERARGLIEARFAALGKAAADHAGAAVADAVDAATDEGAPTATAEAELATASAADRASAGVLHVCGASNDADAVFCKKCGERLSEESEA